METENNNLLTIMNNDEIKKLKNKEYLKKFVEKNKGSIKDKIECPICYSTYSYFNKSKHCKTKRHIKLLSVKSNNKIALSI